MCLLTLFGCILLLEVVSGLIFSLLVPAINDEKYLIATRLSGATFVYWIWRSIYSLIQPLFVLIIAINSTCYRLWAHCFLVAPTGSDSAIA